MVPCLKTGLRYLFLLSTEDLNKSDEERRFCRWLMPYERPGLQGADAQMALYLNAGQLVHATGNAYPAPLIGACSVPIINRIAKSGLLVLNMEIKRKMA